MLWSALCHSILPEIAEILLLVLMPNLLVQTLDLVFFCILFQEYKLILDEDIILLTQGLNLVYRLFKMSIKFIMLTIFFFFSLKMIKLYNTIWFDLNISFVDW